MKKMNLKEFWKDCSVESKNRILLELTRKFQNSIETVRSWFLGYRKPKGFYRENLYAYIKENFQVEIIEEGGDQ